VRAVDDAGNKDASPVQHTWAIDTTAPQTGIDSGPNGTVIATAAAFGFSADELGSTFECRLDGGTWEANCTSLKSYTPGELGEGTHTFRVRATDALGNTDPTPAHRSWTIDTTGPATSFDSVPQNPSGSSGANIHFSADEPGSTFECRLGTTGPFDACTSPVSLSGLSDGSHTLQVQATDPVGNTGSIEPFTWTTDTTRPDVQILAPGMPPTTSSSVAEFEFTSSDTTATFQCRLDAGNWQNCGDVGSGTRAYGALDEGPHTFDVRARDAVGNVSDPHATDMWTVVDSDPPDGTIDSGPADPTTATTASFTFSADEASSFQCKLDTGALLPCGNGMTGNISYPALSLGPHTFTLLASDADGPDPTAATWTWQVINPATGGGGTAGAAAQSPTIVPGRRALKRGRGTAATVTCPTGPCTITGKAKVKIAGTSYRARVRATSPLASGNAANVTIVLSKAARAALAAAAKGVLKLRLTAGSSTGNVSKSIKLKVTK
jgi:hypothetical protein